MTMKIDAKFVNPFITAGMNVITQVSGIELRRGHLSYKDRPEPSHGVSIIVGVYGFLTGQIVYSIKRELADKLVETMLPDTAPQQRRVLYIDTLGELANMITGNATALLGQKRDLALKITTPAIAIGENLSVTLVSTPTIVLGLYSQFGQVEISIALKEEETLSELQDSSVQLSEV
jgi:chemotaxis protein CheX